MADARHGAQASGWSIRNADDHAKKALRLHSHALVVSSGGSIEPVLVAAFPDVDHAGWGGPLHQLEGATILVDGGRFMSIKLRRRPPPPWKP